MNLLRGASSTGLGAMRPGTRRPLLALRRAATVGLCESLESPWSTTRRTATRRTCATVCATSCCRLMNAMARRDLVPVLTRQAALLRDDADLLDELALAIDPTDAMQLAAAPLPLARRALRRWLTIDHPPDPATVERVMSVADGSASACDLGGGRRVERSRQRLRLLGNPSETPSR